MLKLPTWFTPRFFVMIAFAITLALDPVSDPAVASADDVDPPYETYLPLVAKSGIEWTFHKTADGQHPNGNEQQMMWLMNRARANPAQEGYWLATTTESDIAFARSYFGVDTTVLRNEFNSYSTKPPAAFDVRMYNGSKVHSDDLIARDAQDHNNQFARIESAGFYCWGGRANVFSYADSSLNAHGAFNIDWGGSDYGMQSGRGHRKAIMSLDGDYTNVGIAMVQAPSGKNVGPLVTSAAYCNANTSKANHFNRFIVGTVWRDNNGNGRYDPGEGYGNITVTPNQGKYYAVTGVAGGYAIPIEAAGAYRLIFTGAVSGQVTVTVGSVSVLADLLVPGGGGAQAEELPAAEPTRPVQAPPPGIQLP